MNKKYLIRIIGLVLMITALPLIAACGGGDDKTDASSIAVLVINQKNIDLTNGLELQTALIEKGFKQDDAYKIAVAVQERLKAASDPSSETENLVKALEKLKTDNTDVVVNAIKKPTDTKALNGLVVKSDAGKPESNVSALTADTTPAATPAPTNPPIKGTTAVGDIAKIFKLDTAVVNDCWTISADKKRYDDPQNAAIKAWISRLGCADPAHWKTFPNIRNADVPAFPTKNCFDIVNEAGKPDKKCEVPQGAAYGTYSTPFCQQDMRCDYPVGAWEYRYFTGDYNFRGYSCEGDKSHGCMLLVFNLMDESYIWRNQTFDNGFTLRGRYFDGDNLEWAVVGLVSHASANLLNMPTLAAPGEVLNAGAPGNSGANCGNPDGCGSVDVLVVITTGDFTNAVLHTTVTPKGGGK